MIKDIKGFEGGYQVDTKGNMYSIKYGKRRLLKPFNNKQTGYLQVNLYKEGKKNRVYVHRLVAETFIPNPENLPMVNHKNEIKNDNRIDNLEWCTAKYNNCYGTCRKRISEKLKGRKLSEKHKEKISEANKGIFINRSDQSKRVNQYTKDGLLIASYPSLYEVFRQTGFHFGNISKCCLGRYKQSYGYIWKYSE